MSAHDEWRWTDERGVQRLVSTEELRDALESGVIPGTTLVWCHGMPAWAPALEVPEFATAALDATQASEAPTDDDTVREIPAEEAPVAPEDAVTPMPAVRSPEKAGAAPFASRMARYRDAALAAEPRAGSARALPRASDPKAPAAREPMRTLTGIDAPEKARPGASSPPIIVPSAGGAPEPGVARAITQVPRYSVPGGVTERDIPRAPKLPFAGGVTGQEGAPAPENGARRIAVDPLEVGWSLPPAATPDVSAGREQQAGAGVSASREQQAGAGVSAGREQQAGAGVSAGREQQAGAGVSAAREQQAGAEGDAKAPARPQATRGAAGATGLKSAPLPRPIARGATAKPTQVAASPAARANGPAPAKAQDRQAPAAAAAGPAEETPAPPKAAGRPARFLPRSVPPPPVPVRSPSVPPRDHDPVRAPIGPRVVPMAHERRTNLGATPLAARAQAAEASGPAQAVSPGLAPQANPAAPHAGPAASLEAAVNPDHAASLEAAASPDAAASLGHAGTDPTGMDRTAAVLRRAAMSAAATGGRADASTPLAGQVAPSPQGTSEAPAADPIAAPATASPEVRAAPNATPLPDVPTARSAQVSPPVAGSSQRPASAAATPAPIAATPAPIAATPAPIAATPAPTAPTTTLTSRAEPDALDAPPARLRAAWKPGESWMPLGARADARLLKEPVQVPLLSLVGAGGALIFMVLMAFFIGRCSIAGDSRDVVETAQVGLGSAPGIARTSIPTPPRPCYVARQPRRWAPLVAKSIPFDVAATGAGALAVGYARGADEAVGIEVDPATGAVVEKFSRTETSPVARVYPAPLDDERFVVVTEGQAGLRYAVQVPATPPFVIGLAAGALSAADRQDAPPTPLWPLTGEEELEALRAAPAGAQGHAITFRRDKAVWAGWIGADRKPAGELTKVIGSGGAVGKPSSGWNGREIAVIFADRPADRARWEIRVGHAEPGKVPSLTEVIPLPDGGPGGDAFAPDIAGLPDGRWVLVWTEGPPGSRAMRAQTLGPDFAKVGDPIALSPPAGNFGQGILGVSMGYVGAVFLSKPAASYELWGVILQCG